MVHEHAKIICELKAASQQRIEIFGVVDLEARFMSISNGKRSVKVFVLRKCIVADAQFCVISPFQFVARGWNACFGEGSESFLESGKASEYL